jgi:pimeloyl-ACP methyl ester carboxylesterase
VDEPSSVAAWEAGGRRLRIGGDDIWVRDEPARHDAGLDPILVLHGFPSCSFDWRHVLPTLAERRRVVLFDFLGFGLSSKPDRRYGLRLHADTAEAVCAALGVDRAVLLTHDMGDSVGGELLARDLDGDLDLTVTRRVLTNGSIYLALAQLSPGQLLLLDLDDARLDSGLGPDPGAGLRDGLAATFSPEHPADDEELAAQWALVARGDGHLLLPRTIRYVEDRRAEESRFTGAIEAHPSPLAVVWGDRDPIAVVAMVERLRRRRPDADAVVLDGVGHYPMIEDPGRVAAAVTGFLDGSAG